MFQNAGGVQSVQHLQHPVQYMCRLYKNPCSTCSGRRTAQHSTTVLQYGILLYSAVGYIQRVPNWSSTEHYEERKQCSKDCAGEIDSFSTLQTPLGPILSVCCPAPPHGWREYCTVPLHDDSTARSLSFIETRVLPPAVACGLSGTPFECVRTPLRRRCHSSG